MTIARSTLRDGIDRTLAESAACQAMSTAERRELASNMESALGFLQRSGVPRSALPFVQAQGAVATGGRAMRRLVHDVDFPAFVSSLIQGVFRSIVDSSVQQMQEYAKFLASVAKSVAQFADEQVSTDEARDYLTSRFPKSLEKTTDGDSTRLALKASEGDEGPPDFQSLFGLTEKPDLEDPASEGKLVRAAQLELAKQRQQMLATMVLLGINRIIVTEGTISAMVVFDVTASEHAASTSDRQYDNTDTGSVNANKAETDTYQAGGAAAALSTNRAEVFTRVSTQHAAATAKSSQDADLKAKLSGNVTVKFRSETFPLERMASPMELASLNQKAQK